MENVRIVLHKDEIIADVKGIAYVTGRKLFQAGAVETAADVQTPESGPDWEIVTRAISMGFDQVRRRCGRYLSVGRIEDNNSLDSMLGDYVIELGMPDRWNFAMTSYVKNLAHNHIVDYCLYSLFEKTNPEESTTYLEKAVNELGKIKPVLEMRTGPIRRRPRFL